jgi:hypothetical protein
MGTPSSREMTEPQSLPCAVPLVAQAPRQLSGRGGDSAVLPAGLAGGPGEPELGNVWLRSMRPGERIYVRRSDETLAIFTVTAVRTYARSQFPTARVCGPAPDAELAWSPMAARPATPAAATSAK